MIDKKKAIVGGLGVGISNGLFGGGGGMIAVPYLSKALCYEKKQAHATAIFIILPVCALSAIIYIIYGFADLSVIIPATAGNLAGGFLGAKLLGRLPRKFVSVMFILVMAIAGIRMLIG